jgi:hypothetical protein
MNTNLFEGLEWPVEKKKVNYVPFGKTEPSSFEVRTCGPWVSFQDMALIVYSGNPEQQMIIGNLCLIYQQSRQSMLMKLGVMKDDIKISDWQSSTPEYKHFIEQGSWLMFKAQLYPTVASSVIIDHMKGDHMDSLHNAIWSEIDDVVRWKETATNLIHDPEATERVDDYIVSTAKRLRKQFDKQEARLLSTVPEGKRPRKK